MSGAPPIHYTIATARSADVTTLAGNGRRKFADDLGGPKLCCAYLIKGDKNNTTVVLVGQGDPSYPIAAKEAVFTDLPPGVLIDISKLEAVDATKTGGQILHVLYWEVTGNPPQGTAKKDGTPDDLNPPPGRSPGATP